VRRFNHDLVSLYGANSPIDQTLNYKPLLDDITELVVGIAQKTQQDSSLNPTINPVHFTICMWGMTVGIHQMIKLEEKYTENLNISEQDLLAAMFRILENGIRAIFNQ
jgi:hypothetical protein